MILTKTVTIKPSGKSISYYKNKGYNVKWHENLEVSVNDLPNNSNVIILAKCDNPECQHEHEIHYSKYTKNTKENNGKYFCKDCWSSRLSLIINELYGVNNISQLDYIKKQKKDTCYSHFGVEYYLQSEELKEKMYDTCEKRYNTRNIAELESVKQKRRETCLIKYGYDNPLMNPEIKQKSYETNIRKYGTPFVSQVPEIKKKASETMNKNQTCSTSRQQIYLHNLYGGELNGVIAYYNCDIVFRSEKFITEYDGGGHYLSIEFGDETLTEFNQRELIRDKLIKRQGYKIMRIISRHDKLPSDEILLSMLSAAQTYFITTEHTWIEYDIDNQTVRNALNKEGVFFDYGELRTIKKEGVNKWKSTRYFYW